MREMEWWCLRRVYVNRERQHDASIVTMPLADDKQPVCTAIVSPCDQARPNAEWSVSWACRISVSTIAVVTLALVMSEMLFLRSYALYFFDECGDAVIEYYVFRLLRMARA